MQWNLYLVTAIEQPLWRIALHTGIYPEVERSDAEISLARRDCEEMVGAIEDYLSNRTYMIGTELSVADFNAAYTLDWADYQKLLAEAPDCRRFVEQVYELPKAPPPIAPGCPLLHNPRPTPAAAEPARAHDPQCMPWTRHTPLSDPRELAREFSYSLSSILEKLAGQSAALSSAPPPLLT